MDEIRLSFAAERFHLEHEVIALIEVAFITLPYYMSKMSRARPLYLHTASQQIRGMDGWIEGGEEEEEGGGRALFKKITAAPQ